MSSSSAPSSPIPPATTTTTTNNNNNNTPSTSTAPPFVPTLPQHYSDPAISSDDDGSSVSSSDEVQEAAPSSSAHAAHTTNKPEKGSCHQCKTTRQTKLLIGCTSKAEKGKRRRKCRKKYCAPCLQRTYGLVLPDVNSGERATWVCPSCNGTCTCAACQRKARTPYNHDIGKNGDVASNMLPVGHLMCVDVDMELARYANANDQHAENNNMAWNNRAGYGVSGDASLLAQSPYNPALYNNPQLMVTQAQLIQQNNGMPLVLPSALAIPSLGRVASASPTRTMLESQRRESGFGPVSSASSFRVSPYAHKPKSSTRKDAQHTHESEEYPSSTPLRTRSIRTGTHHFKTPHKLLKKQPLTVARLVPSGSTEPYVPHLPPQIAPFDPLAPPGNSNTNVHKSLARVQNMSSTIPGMPFTYSNANASLPPHSMSSRNPNKMMSSSSPSGNTSTPYYQYPPISQPPPLLNSDSNNMPRGNNDVIKASPYPEQSSYPYRHSPGHVDNSSSRSFSDGQTSFAQSYFPNQGSLSPPSVSCHTSDQCISGRSRRSGSISTSTPNTVAGNVSPLPLELDTRALDPQQQRQLEIQTHEVSQQFQYSSLQSETSGLASPPAVADPPSSNSSASSHSSNSANNNFLSLVCLLKQQWIQTRFSNLESTNSAHIHAAGLSDLTRLNLSQLNNETLDTLMSALGASDDQKKQIEYCARIIMEQPQNNQPNEFVQQQPQNTKYSLVQSVDSIPNTSNHSSQSHNDHYSQMYSNLQAPSLTNFQSFPSSSPHSYSDPSHQQMHHSSSSIDNQHAYKSSGDIPAHHSQSYSSYANPPPPYSNSSSYQSCYSSHDFHAVDHVPPAFSSPTSVSPVDDVLKPQSHSLPPTHHSNSHTSIFMPSSSASSSHRTLDPVLPGARSLSNDSLTFAPSSHPYFDPLTMELDEHGLEHANNSNLFITSPQLSSHSLPYVDTFSSHAHHDAHHDSFHSSCHHLVGALSPTNSSDLREFHNMDNHH